MIRVLYDRGFLKSAKLLPRTAQVKLAAALEIFALDPFDARLHTKHLSGELAGYLSFRISKDYRVLFAFTNAQAVELRTVAHRKDIYR